MKSFSTSLGRLALVLLCAALASCAHRAQTASSNHVPLDQQLNEFARMVNAGQFDMARTHLAKGAAIQSPVSLRILSTEAFLASAKEKPFQWTFSNTEILYSTQISAHARSTANISVPGRPALSEPASVDWRFEDGFWRIYRIEFPNWPQILGDWKRSGMRGEGYMTLQIMPGGAFILFADDDFTLPALKGTYSIQSNQITFTDTYAGSKTFGRGVGVYRFIFGAGRSLTLQKISDDNAWRSERFAGPWSTN